MSCSDPHIAMRFEYLFGVEEGSTSGWSIGTVLDVWSAPEDFESIDGSLASSLIEKHRYWKVCSIDWYQLRNMWVYFHRRDCKWFYGMKPKVSSQMPCKCEASQQPLIIKGWLTLHPYEGDVDQDEDSGSDVCTSEYLESIGT